MAFHNGTWPHEPAAGAGARPFTKTRISDAPARFVCEERYSLERSRAFTGPRSCYSFAAGFEDDRAFTATRADLFQAPFRAGKLLDHQLTPLEKALELPRANLFIADGMGLGKTIEAGLVMQELELRQRMFLNQQPGA